MTTDKRSEEELKKICEEEERGLNLHDCRVISSIYDDELEFGISQNGKGFLYITVPCRQKEGHFYFGEEFNERKNYLSEVQEFVDILGNADTELEITKKFSFVYCKQTNRIIVLYYGLSLDLYLNDGLVLDFKHLLDTIRKNLNQCEFLYCPPTANLYIDQSGSIAKNQYGCVTVKGNFIIG